MNKQEAINIVSQAMGSIAAPLKDHQIMQQAVQFLSTLEEPKPKEVKKVDKKWVNIMCTAQYFCLFCYILSGLGVWQND